MTKKVSNESKSLTSSNLFNTSIENSDIRKFSFASQNKEALDKAPFSMAVFNAFGTNPRIGRNKVKTVTAIIPSIMTAVNTLLQTRTQQCNMLASIIGLILKQGQAEKRCISRLANLSLSVSYNTVISAQTSLGKTFLKTVNEWIQEGEADLEKLLSMTRNIDEIEDEIPVMNDEMSKMNISFGRS